MIRRGFLWAMGLTLLAAPLARFLPKRRPPSPLPDVPWIGHC
jgi:hypothetical protein